jgi:hypothetical protein
MRVHQFISGEPAIIQNHMGQIEACCDCGLSHFRIYEIVNHKIKIYTYRDEYETRRIRAKMKKKTRKHK